MADREKRREEANGIKTIDYELRDSRIICQNKTLNWELHMYSVCHNCVVHRVPQLPCSMSECLIIKQNLGLEAISAPVCHNCVVHRVPLNFQPRAWRACTPNHLQIISQGARPSALSTPKFGKKSICCCCHSCCEEQIGEKRESKCICSHRVPIYLMACVDISV